MRSLEKHRELFLKALSQQNWQEVVLNATEIIKIDASEPMVWSNRGVALHKLGFPIDAILNYDKSIMLEAGLGKNSAINYANKGAAYWDIYDADAAKMWLNAAIKADPSIAQAHMTLGNVYKDEGMLQTALKCYQSSVEANPDYADGHLVYSMALLGTGYFEVGWKEYEWRWKSEQMPPRRMQCPLWSGEDLTGKTILVWGEQGLGDMIQFGRYVSVLGNQFPRAKIIVEGRHPVKRLFETIPEAYAVVNSGDKLPYLDYHVPMLTLAGLLTPNINSIVANEREYLLRPDDVEAWEYRMRPLFDMKPGALKVGICWAGMSRDAHPGAAAIDAIRSTHFDSFAPLMKNPDILWVNLQKGPPAAQFKEGMPVNCIIGDFTDDMYDFYETCCAIENCDLVISVDTAVVHAAASIGKPTWLLSRWDGCWRWFGNRSDSPWYPSLRQFVQPQRGDWDGMMHSVARELQKLTQNKKQQELDLTLAK